CIRPRGARRASGWWTWWSRRRTAARGWPSTCCRRCCATSATSRSSCSRPAPIWTTPLAWGCCRACTSTRSRWGTATGAIRDGVSPCHPSCRLLGRQRRPLALLEQRPRQALDLVAQLPLLPLLDGQAGTQAQGLLLPPRCLGLVGAGLRLALLLLLLQF